MDRVCTVCKEFKKDSEYYPPVNDCRDRKARLRTQCIACDKLKQKAYRDRKKLGFAPKRVAKLPKLNFDPNTLIAGKANVLLPFKTAS